MNLWLKCLIDWKKCRCRLLLVMWVKNVWNSVLFLGCIGCMNVGVLLDRVIVCFYFLGYGNMVKCGWLWFLCSLCEGVIVMCVFSVIMLLWLVSSGLMFSVWILGMLVVSCVSLISISVMVCLLVVGMLWYVLRMCDIWVWLISLCDRCRFSGGSVSVLLLIILMVVLLWLNIIIGLKVGLLVMLVISLCVFGCMMVGCINMLLMCVLGCR